MDSYPIVTFDHFQFLHSFQSYRITYISIYHVGLNYRSTNHSHLHHNS